MIYCRKGEISDGIKKTNRSFKDFSITESDKTGMLSIYFKNIGFDGLEVPVSSIIYLFETNAVLMSFILPKVKEGISLDKIDEVLDSMGEGEITQLGTVIGKVKMLVGNAADGAVVARLVKERLAK